MQKNVMEREKNCAQNEIETENRHMNEQNET